MTKEIYQFILGLEFKEKREIQINTIEELLLHSAESGTHSILDIISIEESDSQYKSGKVSNQHMLAMFSTLKPTKSMGS